MEAVPNNIEDPLAYPSQAVVGSNEDACKAYSRTMTSYKHQSGTALEEPCSSVNGRESHVESASETGSQQYDISITHLVDTLSSFVETFTTCHSSTPSHEVSQPLNKSSHSEPAQVPSLNKQSPDFSLRKTEIEALVKQKKNLSLFAYGRFLTISSLILAVAALILAVLSKKSLDFARVGSPIELSPQLNLVEHVGLMKVELCYNETNNSKTQTRALRLINLPLSRSLSVEAVPTVDAGLGVNHHEQQGCFILELTVETIDDVMWNVSRSFLSLAIIFGAFLTGMLCLSVYWESINLKPVAMGMLMTYFFQSLSFLFFDSELCRENTCHFSEGSIESIVASLLWFLCALCCIRMDLLYQARRRQWLRRRNRALKKIKLHRKASQATEQSFPASSHSFDELEQSAHSPHDRAPMFAVETENELNGRSDALACNQVDGFEAAATEQGKLYEC